MFQSCIPTIICIVIMIVAMNYQPFIVLAQNTRSKSTPAVVKTMDPLHKFSVEYNSTIVMNSSTTRTGPLWRLTVFTKVDPHSQPIEKVSYASYPDFQGAPGGIDRITTNDSQSNFEIGFDGLFAGPRINVTAYFKDKTVEYPGNPVNILLPCRPDLCPIEFNIKPNIHIDNGLNVELTGNVTAKYGAHITSIKVDWGDGKSSNNIIPPIGNKPFTFSHAYHTTESRTITISATSDRKFTLNQVVATTSVLAQRNLPKDSPVRLSDSANAYMDISTTTDTIYSDTPPQTPIVTGKLSNLTGSGIPNQIIDITYLSNNTHRITDKVDTVSPNGEYIAKIPFLLTPGTYKIIAQPEGAKYVGFNVTNKLTVIPHALTLDQYIQYSSIIVGIAAAAVAVIAGIIKVPAHRLEKKQSAKLRDCIRGINNEYIGFKMKPNPSQTDKDRYWNDLEESRSNFMDLLARKDISEDQYKILDEMISIYSKKVK